MSDVIEEMQKKAVLKRTMEIALEALKAGQTVEFASSITNLSLETVKQLAIDNNIAYTSKK